MSNQYPIAIIGGGPVGLAAAAQLALHKQPFLLFESGESVGENILSWKHVRVFSPWRYNIDQAARVLFERKSIPLPKEDEIPTGLEIVERYLRPLSTLVGQGIHLSARVLSIGKEGVDKMKTLGREARPFEIRVAEEGRINRYLCSAVIDASGTWHNQNPIGAGGFEAEGESEHFSNIFYGIADILGADASRFGDQHTLVVGGGHSAINSLLALDDLRGKFSKTKISWVLRKEKVRDVYGGKEADALEARGALGIRIEELVNTGRLRIHTPFQIKKIEKKNGKLVILGEENSKLASITGVDQIIANTGSKPDFSFHRELRFDEDCALECVPALAEMIDPNIHSCGSVRPHGEAELRQREEGFYIVGMKSYGRAPTFLMATGYEQVRSVVAHLMGDFEAAKRVELNLPQTGVCSSDKGYEACCGEGAPEPHGASCCGPKSSGTGCC